MSLLFFFLLIPPPPRSTLFPYTTLFRSLGILEPRRQRREVHPGRGLARDALVGGRRRRPLCRQRHRYGHSGRAHSGVDRKSTRLNSSHEWISYAVFCLKKKKKKNDNRMR